MPVDVVLLLVDVLVLELDKTLLPDLLVVVLDVCFDPGDVLARDVVEEDLLLLVLVDDKRLVLLNLVEGLVEVLMLVIIDDVEIFLLLDPVDDILVTGLFEDDDNFKVDLVGFDDVFFDEEEVFEIVWETGSTLSKTQWQACRTAGTFSVGMGESVLGLYHVSLPPGPHSRR